MKINTTASAQTTRLANTTTPRTITSRAVPVLLAVYVAAWFAAPAEASDKDTLNSEEVTFVRSAAADNMGDALVSQVGVSKASSSQVKTFADMMAKENAVVGEKLAKLASSKGVDLSAGVDPKMAETIQDLEKHSGADFDKHFAAVIVSDQQEGVTHFEKASATTKNADLKAWVDKMIPTLKARLASAKELDGNVAAAAKPAMTPTPLDQGNSKSDIDITAQIRRTIIAEKDLSTNAHNVKIITTNGKVTLRGPVNSEAERLLVGQIAARTVAGINIDSQLEVK